MRKIMCDYCNDFFCCNKVLTSIVLHHKRFKVNYRMLMHTVQFALLSLCSWSCRELKCNESLKLCKWIMIVINGMATFPQQTIFSFISSPDCVFVLNIADNNEKERRKILRFNEMQLHFRYFACIKMKYNNYHRWEVELTMIFPLRLKIANSF